MEMALFSVSLIAIASVIQLPLDGEEISRNIAAGAPYTLAPAPQYVHCTDPGDAAQLTDGTCVEGYFWTQPGTVGWTNAKPVVITVDLGEDRPIRGASFNTAAGAAGVAWPASIGIYVAAAPDAFHRVGDLVTLGAKNGLPPAEGYAIHRYWTHELQTHGRYVALAAQFLSTRPAEVAGQGYLPSFQWKDPLDRTLADTVRIEALELLAEVAAKPQ